MHLPKPLADAHREYLIDNGWWGQYDPAGSGGVIGGASDEEACDHVVNRFLNSAARMQYACSDPKDEQADVRDAVLDQLAEGRIHVIDLAAGNGAGTMSMLSLICELRCKGLIPQLPLNVSVSAVDFSPAALNHFIALLDKLSPWLASAGINVELNLCHCDLTVLGDFSETLDGFFTDARARSVSRFLCVISAISGAKKEGVEPIIDSLKHAAAMLSHSRRSSSWLWVEPYIGKSWFTTLADVIRLTLTKIQHKFLSKGESFSLTVDVPMLEDPATRSFNWKDPHNGKAPLSRVIVLAFRNR
ncbi:MAG: hypothetical protein IPN92_05205 [Chromatiaceae bacterium]|nr:hypothetical protein [Chromatiaceae bacterium]